jgi:hypothetical protein
MIHSSILFLRSTKGIYLDVLAGIDIATRKAYWEFTSIDPNTGVEPLNIDTVIANLDFSLRNRGKDEIRAKVITSIKFCKVGIVGTSTLAQNTAER